MPIMAHSDGLAEGEQLVLIVHPHWKIMVGPFAVAFAVVVVGLVAEILIPSGSAANVARLAVAVVTVLALMVWLMVPVLRWRTTMYEMTTRRLRTRAGIIARRGRDIPLSRITDVSFEKGLLDRMLGSGRLVVESAGEHGQMVLTEIPHVERVQSLLFQLVEDERDRVGQEDRRRLD